MNERAYVRLDKDCYIAGEDIWFKFLAVNHELAPSALSKVGYIELSDTEKPQLQWKIALDKGVGAGRFRIPQGTPSGMYRLYAYTRFMQNEGMDVYFQRDIAIINMEEPGASERVRLAEPSRIQWSRQDKYPNISVSTDKSVYANRSLVNLSLGMLPGNITDLAVTVYRNDSIASVAEPDSDKWLQQVKDAGKVPAEGNILAEHEGHVITGKLVTLNGEAVKNIPERYSANIGFVGKDIKYINGKTDNSGMAHFYTRNIYGPQEVVTTVTTDKAGEAMYRMDLLSPFAGLVPDRLPMLTLAPANQKLMDRYLGTQLQQLSGIDSLGNRVPLDKYYYFQNPRRYDLDEYTRFNTVGETIIEFIMTVKVRTVDGKRRLKVFSEDDRRFNSGNTLVLLDGIPMHDHENILKYNPLNVKCLDIYDGRYLFGNELFDGIVTFTTYSGKLPGIQLSDNMQLLEYDCPIYPETFNAPNYPDEESKASLVPDFRHTLYWNPFITLPASTSTTLSFYTSDLSGEFRVVVEGVTKDGRMVIGRSGFVVR